MSLFKKSIIFYFSLITASIILHSCGFCKGEGFRIIGIDELTIFQKSNRNQDLIKDEFIIRLTPDSKIVQNLEFPSIITTSLASIDCFYDYLNPIDFSTLNLSSNKAFNYQGGAVEADEDFIHLGGIIVEDLPDSSPEIVIFFSSDFLEYATFQEGMYTFSITAETTDGVILTGEVSSYLDFE